MNLLNKNIEPIDPNIVTQLVLPDGTRMPQAAMGTFHSDNTDLVEIMEDIIVESIRLETGGRYFSGPKPACLGTTGMHSGMTPRFLKPR